MKLLAIDDLELSDLALPTLPLISNRSSRMIYSVRRGDGLAGSVYFGGQPEPATWVVAFKIDTSANRDTILSALGSDLTRERRLLAIRDDDNQTRVTLSAAPVKISEINVLDMEVTFESEDSVWTAEGFSTATKLFTSSLDNALAVPVPGNTLTVPTVILTPSVQRTAPSAVVGWRYRRRYVVKNLSRIPWLNIPLRISLGDTTGLTPDKALPFGEDVRIVVDGIEQQRTLVSWDTAASHVWTILASVQPGESQTVEVWYGNPAATNPPLLAYPSQPPLLMDLSSNAAWVFGTNEVAVNKGKGIWYLFATVAGSAVDFTVPGSWRPAATLENLDNKDDHAQQLLHPYSDTGAWVLAGLDVWRAAPGYATFPAWRNPYDGVSLYHPLGISSIVAGFAMTNENGVGALMVLARDSAAEEWQQLLYHATIHATLTTIAAATYTPAKPVKHIAAALWPANRNFIPENTLGLSYAKFVGNIQVNIDTTNLSITGGTEEEIYELATILRVGGGANGSPPYRSLHIGNAANKAGAGVPRAAVVLDQQTAVVNGDERSHEVWSLIGSSEPWTPDALGGQLRAWWKADAITGVADGGIISSWPDSSANINSALEGAAGSGPTFRANRLNGLPAAEFDGGDWMTAPVTASSVDETILAVVRIDTDATRSLLASTPIGGRMFGQIAPRHLYYEKYGNAAIGTAAGQFSLATQMIIGGTLGATTWSMNINGVLESGTHAQTLVAGTTTLIGGSAFYWDGDVYEIIVMRTASTIKRQLVEGYLAWKWGLQASLPGGHPYRNVRPTALIPGLKVEDLPTYAVTTIAGWDDGGTTRESPANAWLPLIPSRAEAVGNGAFDAGLDTWVPSVSETTAYAAQVGAPGAGAGQFNDAGGLEVDTTGKVFVADTLNERVHRLTAVPAADITFGTSGTGVGQFYPDNGVFDVAVDIDNNVLATDRGNQRVQRFNGLTGAVIAAYGHAAMAWQQRTFAGTPGVAAGNITPTYLNNPLMIARDPTNGNIWIADNGNSRLVKLDRYGNYLYHANVWSGIYGLCIDPSGYIYVMYYPGNAWVLKYSPSLANVWSFQFAGMTTYFCCTDGINFYFGAYHASGGFRAYRLRCSDGNLTTIVVDGTGAGFIKQPTGMAVDSTYLYIMDQGNNRIQKWNKTTNAYIGQFANGQFNNPYGLSVDWDGNLMVCNYGTNEIRTYTNTGTFVRSQTINRPFALALAPERDSFWMGTYQNHTVERVYKPLAAPHGIATKRSIGRIYTTDPHLHRVDALDGNGNYLFSWGQWGTANGLFQIPIAVDVNQLTGDVYVVDQGNYRVQQFTENGVFLRAWGTPGTGNGQFMTPTGIAINPISGDVSVIDAGRDDIQRFSSIGNFISKLGSAGTGNAQFQNGIGLGFNADGTSLYAGDSQVERVQRFTNAPLGLVAWDGTLGGEQNGSILLQVSIAPATTGVAVRAVNDVWHALNTRESVQVAAWCVTNSPSLVPVLQIEFGDELGNVLATSTEPVWTPVAGREYRRNFAAAPPGRVTQYRLAVAAYATTTVVVGQVHFDDLSLNANELTVSDQAIGELRVDIAVPGRWLG